MLFYKIGAAVNSVTEETPTQKGENESENCSRLIQTKLTLVQEAYGKSCMVFSGSLGTAKTTVARLFARIMKENGLLSVGHLFIDVDNVTKADLLRLTADDFEAPIARRATAKIGF